MLQRWRRLGIYFGGNILQMQEGVVLNRRCGSRRSSRQRIAAQEGTWPGILW